MPGTRLPVRSRKPAGELVWLGAARAGAQNRRPVFNRLKPCKSNRQISPLSWIFDGFNDGQEDLELEGYFKVLRWPEVN
jgi:hypothetical protein